MMRKLILTLILLSIIGIIYLKKGSSEWIIDSQKCIFYFEGKQKQRAQLKYCKIKETQKEKNAQETQETESQGIIPEYDAQQCLRVCFENLNQQISIKSYQQIYKITLEQLQQNSNNASISSDHLQTSVEITQIPLINNEESKDQLQNSQTNRQRKQEKQQILQNKMQDSSFNSSKEQNKPLNSQNSSQVIQEIVQTIKEEQQVLNENTQHRSQQSKENIQISQEKTQVQKQSHSDLQNSSQNIHQGSKSSGEHNKSNQKANFSSRYTVNQQSNKKQQDSKQTPQNFLTTLLFFIIIIYLINKQDKEVIHEPKYYPLISINERAVKQKAKKRYNNDDQQFKPRTKIRQNQNIQKVLEKQIKRRNILKNELKRLA